MLGSSGSLQADYMKILVAQLQYQNPLEPLDNNEMTSQLAMFAQLAQLETLNASFSDVLGTVENNYAASMVGKNISFLGQTEDGSIDVLQGTVERTYKNTSEDKLYLVVGEYTLGLNDVISVNQNQTVSSSE